jgi:hypothetical protein
LPEPWDQAPVEDDVLADALYRKGALQREAGLDLPPGHLEARVNTIAPLTT